MNLRVDVSREDVEPFLWLQKLMERRLIEETFRRAKAAGILEAKADSLWCAEVYIDRVGGDNHIFVTHDVPTGDRKPYDRKSYTEQFTLAEALRLCMEGE